MHTYQVRGGQRLMLGVFLNQSLLYVLRQSLSLNLELRNDSRLASQQAPEILMFPMPQSLALYTCIASTLLSELSPQSIIQAVL